jgi:hypothetical protein
VGALVAVVGPVFSYAFGPDLAWTMTTGRWVLQVLPGAAVVVGGLFVLAAGNRVSGLPGGALSRSGGGSEHATAPAPTPEPPDRRPGRQEDGTGGGERGTR